MEDPIGITLSVLRDALDGVPVSTEIPSDRPERQVSVTLENGVTDDMLTVALVGLTCWGRSDRDAFGIAQAATEALREAALDHPLLSSARVEALSRDEWTATGQGRYYARVRLVINIDE